MSGRMEAKDKSKLLAAIWSMDMLMDMCYKA